MSDRPRRYRNRVTPFGEIVATPEYGTLMGNRGCLHDEKGEIVRSSARTAWISCLPRWPGIKRTLMQPGHYTELFFLDEPTALAAGHRPCGSCRPEALRAFKTAWAAAQGLEALPRVAEIDQHLALERGTLVPCDAPDALPDGAMVTRKGSEVAWLRWEGRYWRWSFAGHQSAEALPPIELHLITPASIVAVLAQGYGIKAAIVPPVA
jgi:hypothetical protein